MYRDLTIPQRARAVSRALGCLAQGEQRALRTLELHLPHLPANSVTPPPGIRIALPNRAEWLRVRSALATLGASDAARIISGQYGGGWGVYTDWHGMESRAPKHAEDGLDVEPLTAGLYEQMHSDRTVTDPGDEIVVSAKPWLHASIDRYVVDPEESKPGELELKDHRYLDWYAWGNGGEINSWGEFITERPISVYEAVQVQVQLYVTGLTWCDLAALVPRKGLLAVYRIRRDDQAIAAILAKLEAWRERHLLEGLEPEPDDSDPCGRWLAHRRAVMAEGEREATPEELVLARRYSEARAQAKEGERIRKLTRNQLLSSMDRKRITDGDKNVASIATNGRLSVK